VQQQVVVPFIDEQAGLVVVMAGALRAVASAMMQDPKAANF
jgi:hypothetical protein